MAGLLAVPDMLLVVCSVGVDVVHAMNDLIQRGGGGRVAAWRGCRDGVIDGLGDGPHNWFAAVLDHRDRLRLCGLRRSSLSNGGGLANGGRSAASRQRHDRESEDPNTSKDAATPIPTSTCDHGCV